MPLRKRAAARSLTHALDLTSPWAIYPRALPQVIGAATTALELAALEQPDALRGAAQQRKTAGAVGILTLRGPITPRGSFIDLLFGGGGGLEGFRSNLASMVADDEVAAIVLDIDSPGGSVSLVAETAADVASAAQVKPIVAVANTMAASAAYWIASQASELVVTPSGWVGSVGTVVSHEDWSKFNEEFGVDISYVHAGKYKVEGNPDEPLGDEARAELQRIVDDYQALFTAAVAAGRDVTPATVDSDFGQGRMFTAERAVESGLADRVATLESVISTLLSPSSGSPATAGVSVPSPAALEAAREAVGRRPASEAPSPDLESLSSDLDLLLPQH